DQEVGGDAYGPSGGGGQGAARGEPGHRTQQPGAGGPSVRHLDHRGAEVTATSGGERGEYGCRGDAEEDQDRQEVVVGVGGGAGSEPEGGEPGQPGERGDTVGEHAQ